jgi:hypothetical protein
VSDTVKGFQDILQAVVDLDVGVFLLCVGWKMRYRAHFDLQVMRIRQLGVGK